MKHYTKIRTTVLIENHDENVYIYIYDENGDRERDIHRQEVILNVDTPSEALHKKSNKRSDGKTMTRTAGYAD